jgi:plastocyanin
MVTGILFALAVAACGSGSSGSNSVTAQNQPSASSAGSASTSAGSSATIAGVMANNHGQKDVAGQSAVSVQANSYYFSPSVLKGSAGQKVTLTIANGGSTQHNFTVDAQHINKDIDSNASVTVSVTFPASGILSFFCEYHHSQGMAGGLLVSGDPSGAAAPATQQSSSTTSGWS